MVVSVLVTAVQIRHSDPYLGKCLYIARNFKLFHRFVEAKEVLLQHALLT